MSRFSFMRLLTLILVVGVLTIALIPSAQASGIVTTCNEASLNAALAGGGSITFACSGTITVTSTKVISINTTLDGIGQSVIISGGGNTQIFLVNANVRLNLNNLTLTRGSSINFGGAVMNNGRLNVTNVTFNDNRANNNGAAIYNSVNAIAVVTNSAITYSRTTNNGGAIYNSGSLTITGSTFTRNTTSNSGGAIFNNNGTASISTTSFVNNSTPSNGLGGAIYNHSIMTVTDSTFSSNVGGWGGGIVNSGQNAAITISGSTFSGNVATLGPALYIGNGPASSANTQYTNNGCFGPITDNGGNVSVNSPSCP